MGTLEALQRCLPQTERSYSQRVRWGEEGAGGGEAALGQTFICVSEAEKIHLAGEEM